MGVCKLTHHKHEPKVLISLAGKCEGARCESLLQGLYAHALSTFQGKKQAIESPSWYFHTYFHTYLRNRLSLGSPARKLEDWDPVLFSSLGQGVCSSLNVWNGEDCHHIVALGTQEFVHLGEKVYKFSESKKQGSQCNQDNFYLSGKILVVKFKLY